MLTEDYYEIKYKKRRRLPFVGRDIVDGYICNDLLDLDPVSQITPDSFYKTADQLGAYMINYYGELQNPFSGAMFHGGGYDDGIARSDGNTDIQVVGGGNTQLFVPTNGRCPVESNCRDGMALYVRSTIS